MLTSDQLAQAIDYLRPNAAYTRCDTYTNLSSTWTDSTTIPTEAELESAYIEVARKAKIAELTTKAGALYVAGFSSSASGTAMWYDSDHDSQLVIERLYAEAKYNSYETTTFMTGYDAGVAPITARAKSTDADSTKTVQQLSKTQMITLGDDWCTYFASIKAKLWAYKATVNTATTLTEIEAVNWE